MCGKSITFNNSKKYQARRNGVETFTFSLEEAKEIQKFGDGLEIDLARDDLLATCDKF